MIYFFPMPYPDESMYNIYSRYNTLTGNNNFYITAEELVGNRNVHINLFFANNLEYLCGQFPENAFFNSDYFIQNHTILPFYKSFVPEERFTNAINNFKVSSAKSINSAITTIGYSSGSLYKVSGIAYCPECIKEDKEKYGEAYIHITHQIDGYFICKKHNSILHFYDIPKTKEFIKFYNINELELNDKKIISNTYNDKILNLSCIIEKLFSYYDIMPPYSITKDKYCSMLYEKGYYLKRGNINQEKLHQDFSDYHTKDYLLFMKSYMPPNDTTHYWLKYIASKAKSTLSIHPIRNLLFIDFLFGDIESFIDYQPNALPHFIKPNEHSINTYKSKSFYINRKVQYQNRLLTLLEQEPYLHRKEIYNRMKTTYAWLAKHEYDWLEKTLPPSIQGKYRSKNKKIYWEEKDTFFYSKINNVIHNILKYNASDRITIQYIAKQIKYNRLGNNLYKMPKTKALLNYYRETSNDFYKRRLRNELVKSNSMDINPSDILQKIHVPIKSYEYYYAYVKDILDY